VRRKTLPFLFFVIVGLLLAMALIFLFDQIPLIADTDVFGLPMGSLIAIAFAVPITDWLRKRVFGAQSFGERL